MTTNEQTTNEQTTDVQTTNEQRSVMRSKVPRRRSDKWADERGSIPEWVMLLVMGIGIVMALWAIVQPDLTSLVSDALDQLRR